MKHIFIGGQLDASAISLGCMRMSNLEPVKVDAIVSAGSIRRWLKELKEVV